MFAVDGELKLVALFFSGRLFVWLALSLRREATNARESFDLGFRSSQSQGDLSTIGQMLRAIKFISALCSHLFIRPSVLPFMIAARRPRSEGCVVTS